MQAALSSLRRYQVVAGLAGILLFALIVRVAGLSAAPLWTDELYSVSFAKTPMEDLWGDWMVREPNPPLYYSLLSGWIQIFGETEFGVRFLSVVFSLLGIVGVFLVGRSVHSNTAGLLAAALAAVSSHQLQYSQEARAYMLAFAAASFAILALSRLTDHWLANRVHSKATWGTLALYVGGATVAVYAHTTLILLPLLANVYVLWLWTVRTSRRRESALRWIGANLVLASLCAWWLWNIYRQLTSGTAPVSWIDNISFADAVSKTSRLIGTRSIDGLNLPIALAMGGFMVFGAMRLSVEKRMLALCFGVGIPLLMFVISIAKPVLLERTLLWAQAVYLPCIAAGLVCLPIGVYRVVAASLVLLALSYDAVKWNETSYREPWSTVAALLRDRAGPDDAILVYDADVPVNLDFYERTLGASKATIIAMESAPGKVIFADRFEGPVLSVAELPAALAGYDEIFVLQRGESDGFDEDPTDQVAMFAREVSPNLLGPRLGENNELRLTIWKLSES
jgi:uncharacterized membrane protein